ncbi:glycoside hydrolase family 15 protein [Caballeronia novacaledonica]|uniref:glycoside hydrolase family 15 protein n=1 Tax=Caballeronia novacaledonica TaxID=1544861 RepID=UPI001EE1AA59|nr:glycoside hydrolase family 15 protein [Caballeronia novacaledonica]GJH10903.1 glycoside hydrolase family 15 protein [Caballeronia novacaledonica]
MGHHPEQVPAAALPVDGRGMIGNMKTAALVSLCGAIDFMCFPRIDSPTLFAGLLDSERGGAFSITPRTPHANRRANVKQMYLPETNVLLTRFMTDEGVCELLDLMPVALNAARADQVPNCVLRIVRLVYGRMTLDVRCDPRFDYARATHTAQAVEKGVDFIRADGSPPVRLIANVPLKIDGQSACATLDFKAGDCACFALGEAHGLADIEANHDAILSDTIDYWKAWSSRSTYRGRYREVVLRSALTLKLLSSEEFGAIVAAPTFGLPEAQDGSRRWDYRFTWIRDAAFSVYALLRLGYTGEAERFMKWIAERSRDCSLHGQLRVMYSVDGADALAESPLTSLVGEVPGRVVVGNEARDQMQLDVYGALLDSVYLYNKYGAAISYEGWRHVTRTVDYVVEHWREPDNGIWEFRNGTRALLHSRLMCWVTLDRALRLAEKRSLPAPLANWFKTRDEIHRDIHEQFWNDDIRSFVQTPGSATLDASALMMPLVRFIGPKDPRWIGTLDAIGRDLRVDPLIFRYTRGSTLDGLPGMEGGFSACSFWYAEALARAGRVDEGRLVFEKMLAYANHVGLFSEEVATSGEALGNFPQALTHLALISAAYQLDRNLDRVHVPWT